jgi:hypothetical protein
VSGAGRPSCGDLKDIRESLKTAAAAARRVEETLGNVEHPTPLDEELRGLTLEILDVARQARIVIEDVEAAGAPERG